jgi:LuxR family maltose regulon positive regulatory protein
MTATATLSLTPAPRLTVLPPAPRAALGRGLVARARLVRRLMGVRDVPVVLLVAPAGYGKTTTLLEWAQHDERPFAWVALGPSDDDADHLRASLARAIDPLTSRDRDFVLVLDDVQHLTSKAALDVLAGLVDHPPAGAHVALASRCEPPLALGRMRAHREVFELTSRDFIMTRGEAGALLELAGVSLAATDVDTLVRQTEGWPAGLYLAAVSLRDQPDPPAAVARFGGDDRIVSDYVTDALLAGLPAEQIAFLQRTSVLDRLSGPLCDAVLAQSGSGPILRDLARANALVVRLDRSDEWYATTACWRRCCAPSCAATIRTSKASCTGAPAAGTPSTMTSTPRSATPRRRATRGSREICCGRTPSATSPRATTRPSTAGSAISPTSRGPPTPRWPS